MSNTTVAPRTRTGSKTEYLDNLKSKILGMTTPPKGSFQKDETYWKPEVDKAGSGSAVIRFLPNRQDEDCPVVRLWSHGFQGPTGKWLIDNCPSTLGGIPSDVCPICASNNKLWESTKDKEDPRRKTASERKRKLSFISNILVINDPKHPDNNGKVFKYKYGTRIFDKIKDLLFPPPEFADMQPCEVFSMTEGADFKLRIVKKDGFQNYDKSSFDPPTAIGDDDVIAEIEEQLLPLAEIVAEKNFKSYADLQKRFLQTVGADESAGGNTNVGGDDKPSLESDTEDLPIARPKAPRTTTAKVAGKTAAPKTAPVAGTDASSDDVDYFTKLAAEASAEEE